MWVTVDFCCGQGVEGALLDASQRAKLKILGKVRNSEKLPAARGLTCFVLFALAASLSLLVGVATAQRPAEPKPLWQINARKLGLPRPSVVVNLFVIKLSHGHFGFQNNNTLLISWIAPDGPLPRTPKKASPTPAVLVPSHLHVLFIDAKAGTRLREGEVSVPYDGWTELFISHSGNLLVRAGSSLKLYTPNFVLLNQAELPAPVTIGSFISRPNIKISQDGRSILVCSRQEFSSKTAIFDADDLKSLGSLPDGRQCPVQFGDDSFLFGSSNGRDARQSTIQSWENEPRSPTLRVAGDPRLVELLNGDAFMVANGNGMEVRTMDGKLLMTDSLPKGHWFQTWTAKDARGSTIFAVETTHLTWQLTLAAEIPLPAHSPEVDQILVYSLKEKRRIFTIKARWTDECELSPDGSLFATLSNGWVRVYKLP